MMSRNKSKWHQKNWVTLGDSISATGVFQSIMNKEIAFGDIQNKAYSGGSMTGPDASSTTVIGKSIDYACVDIVTIFAGTNDFKLNRALGAIGSVFDTTFDTNTFYGAYRSLLDYIIASNPNTRIYLWTPLHRDNAGYTIESTNTAGYKLIDYVEAIRKIAVMYSLPVLDLYNNSGINTKNLSAYTNDGLHPNDKGYERIAELAIPFINNY